MAVIFQCGSNIDERRLNSANRLDGLATLIGLGHTKYTYELGFRVFGKRNNCAAADIVPGKGRIIFGALNDVPEESIAKLDRIEGEGVDYERRMIDVHLVSIGHPAQCVETYTALNRRGDVKTSWAYVRHRVEGLKHLDAPGEYICCVLEQAKRNNKSLTFEIDGFKFRELAYWKPWL